MFFASLVFDMIKKDKNSKTKMKYLILSGLLSLGIIGSVQLTNSNLDSEFTEIQQEEKNDTIHWSSTRKLTWDDFKGEIDIKSNYKALTYTTIVVKPLLLKEQIVEYKITCVFETELSWSKSKNSNNLLKHEQLHFDIAELTTRKLRENCHNIDFLNLEDVKQSVREFFYESKNDRTLINSMYDEETEHGTIADKQKEWEIKIAKELKVLEEYSSPRVVIRRK